MKRALILFFFMGCAITTQAQIIPPDTLLANLNFVPEQTDVVGSSPYLIPAKKIMIKNKSGVLFATGFVFQGIKFRNPIDEFHAIAPFDVRGFSPSTFSEYSQTVKLNYPLIKSHANVYGW